MQHKKGRRLVSLLTAVAMIIGLFPAAAFAGDDDPNAGTPVVVTSSEALLSAIDSATDGRTIQLGADITLDQGKTITGKNFILDLNGKTLSSSSKQINLLGNTSLGDTNITIKDSSPSEGKVLNTKIQVRSKSQLTLESGTLESDGSSYAVYVYGGTFVMNGGTVIGAPGVNANSGTTTILGGKVQKNEKGQVGLLSGKGEIILGSEGAASHESPYIQGMSVRSEATYSLYSGTIEWVQANTFPAESILNCVFKQDISDNLPAGKMCTENQDGTFKVEALTEEYAAAKINDDLYPSAVPAAKSLADNQTLVLLKDVEGDSDSALLAVSAYDVTIDLNGHNVTNTNAEGHVISMKSAPSANKACTLTIKNSQTTTAQIKGNVPLYFASTRSNYPVTAQLEGSILLNGTGEQKIELGSGAKLAYSESAAAAIANGGFKGTDKDGNAYIFSSAIAAMEYDANQTATLLNDYNGSTGLHVQGTGIVDLDGHLYTTNDNVAAVEVNEADTTVTIKNGRIVSNHADALGLSMVNASGASGTMNNITITLDNVQLDVNGTAYGAVVNGTNDNDNITLKNNSAINAPNAQIGIYFPPKSGKLTIDNSTVIGKTAIAIKGGTLEVSGNSVIKAVGEKYVPTEGQSSGVNGTGDAIYLEGNYKDRNAIVKILGGTIISEKGEAVNLLFNEQKNETFTNDIDVTNGSFSTPVPEEYLDETLTAQLYSQQKPEAPFSYYTSVEAALQAAQPGDKVVDMSAASTTTCKVTIKYNNGAEDSVDEVTSGTKIKLPAAPSRSGYTFAGWLVNGTRYAAGGVVTISADTEISADWNAASTPSKHNYEVTANAGENGSIVLDKEDKYVTEDEVVTFTVTPDAGYMVEEVTITDASGKEVSVKDNGDGTYTFTMPKSKVTISATFVKDPDYVEPDDPEDPQPGTGVADIFEDVAEGSWYEDAVQYVYDKGLMTGTSTTTFEPNTNTTRGMIVSMLCRLEGNPEGSDAGFADVAAGAWYEQAVNWAASEGIVSGYGETFGPNDPITREQLASILTNYAAYKGEDISARADLTSYADSASISSWASETMSWAVAEGLITGMTDNTLDPQGAATRAQVAAILERYLNK